MTVVLERWSGDCRTLEKERGLESMERVTERQRSVMLRGMSQERRRKQMQMRCMQLDSSKTFNNKDRDQERLPLQRPQNSSGMQASPLSATVLGFEV